MKIASSASRSPKRYLHPPPPPLLFPTLTLIPLKLRTLLLPPLSFHGASNGNRLNRNRRISSTHATDPSTGAELLFVKFWVEGLAPVNDTDTNWWDTVKKWVGPLIWEDSSRPGSYVPTPSVPKVEPPPPEPVGRTWGGWAADGLASVFGGIIPRRKDANGAAARESLFARPRKPALGEYYTGEVFAELEKVRSRPFARGGTRASVAPEADPYFVFSSRILRRGTSFTARYMLISLVRPPCLLPLRFPGSSFDSQLAPLPFADARDPRRHRVNIPTANIGEPQQGWNRYRFWRQASSAVA